MTEKIYSPEIHCRKPANVFYHFLAVKQLDSAKPVINISVTVSIYWDSVLMGSCALY